MLNLIARLVASAKGYFYLVSPVLLLRRSFIGFVTAKSSIHTGEEIYKADLSPMVLIMYIGFSIIILLQIFTPNFFKEENSKLFKWLRIINIVIITLLVIDDCLVDGKISTSSFIIILLEISYEIIHKILLH